ncbi:hypothetical protein HQ393_10395 [Chitinibacter bivalviorum]|uniref:Uncharacterized protein n=1 Tax=Chitinibacter bivalviorum TaxID=2739434 RepID=A0A7H9BIY8_9NEIS|nr:hypothetical protein [Chitinibacter bivalviorum]QLG88613.1 hypothetical protein HQ393_10395 [Chitinibacter bivalviorum]
MKNAPAVTDQSALKQCANQAQINHRTPSQPTQAKCSTLSKLAQSVDNGLAAFNSAAEIGVSNTVADKPLTNSGFFSSVNTTGASSMAGRSGGSFGCAGSYRAGTPTSLLTCHPQLALSGGLLKPTIGGNHHA